MARPDDPAAPVGLDAVLATDELARRPARPPDHAAEARALSELARALAADPRGLLRRLCELVLDACRAESAGVSVLEPGGGDGRGFFRWPAVAGAWAEHAGKGQPGDASPCGVVIARDAPLLFGHPGRFFPDVARVTPPLLELLLVPFHAAGRPVGTVWACLHTPGRGFDAEDRRLLESLARFAAAAHQAVAALDAAEAGKAGLERRVVERTAELRASEEAVAADLANAERLRELAERLVSEEDFATIYDEVLSATVAVARADAGTIQIYDPQTRSLELIASKNFSRTVTDHFHRVDASSRTACGIAMNTGRRAFVDFPDEVADLGCRLLVDEGLQSALALPLVSRTGTPLGMLNAHWRAARHRPTDRELRFLELIARQAADLIEQRQAQRALRASEERLGLALAASRMGTWRWDAAADRHDRDANLNRLLGLPAEESTGPLADLLACVHPADRDRVAAGFEALVRHGRNLNMEFRVVRPDGTIRWLRDQGDVFYGPDGWSLAGAFVDVTDLKEAEVLRRINDELEKRVRERTADLSAALDSLGAEMARRRDLARRLGTAQEDERRRVSRDLHDTVGQLMAGLSLAFKAVETAGDLPPATAAKLAEAQRVADALGKEVHSLAVRLRPTSLDDLGLEAALGQLVAEFSGRTGVPADFHAAGLEPGRLSAEVETTLYRVVQEALTNVARHARAAQVSVAVTRLDGYATAVVEDDGAGYDPGAAAGRLGLAGMRERAALVGGEVEVESRPGAGTTVVARVPVRATEGGEP